MKLRSWIRLGLVGIGALAVVASVVGCSGDSGVSGFPGDDSGTPGANADGSGARMEGAASGSGGGSSGASSSGGSSGASSSAGGSSGSGVSGGSSSSGGSGTPEAGAGADTGNHGGADASGTPDATASLDAGANHDTGSAGGDAGLCADQAAWLTPMNQARAMLNVGEPPLVCDPLAVQVALNYAQQCQAGATPGMLVHNMNRNAQYTALGGTGGLGENIAAGAPTQTPGQAVALWLGEASSYNYANNSCSGTCGHYTQVVWKATTGVGCAHAICNSNFFGGGMWNFNVCDYSPPGNFVGQKPY